MQVVFSEAYWIGTKEENPEEHKMPMPLSIVEAGKKAQGVLLHCLAAMSAVAVAVSHL